jgi:hypothetical protein
MAVCRLERRQVAGGAGHGGGPAVQVRGAPPRPPSCELKTQVAEAAGSATRTAEPCGWGGWGGCFRFVRFVPPSIGI